MFYIFFRIIKRVRSVANIKYIYLIKILPERKQKTSVIIRPLTQFVFSEEPWTQHEIWQLDSPTWRLLAGTTSEELRVLLLFTAVRRQPGPARSHRHTPWTTAEHLSPSAGWNPAAARDVTAVWGATAAGVKWHNNRGVTVVLCFLTCCRHVDQVRHGDNTWGHTGSYTCALFITVWLSADGTLQALSQRTERVTLL